jgi:hypothetical protein
VQSVEGLVVDTALVVDMEFVVDTEFVVDMGLVAGLLAEKVCLADTAVGMRAVGMAPVEQTHTGVACFACCSACTDFCRIRMDFAGRW